MSILRDRTVMARIMGVYTIISAIFFSGDFYRRFERFGKKKGGLRYRGNPKAVSMLTSYVLCSRRYKIAGNTR